MTKIKVCSQFAVRSSQFAVRISHFAVRKFSDIIPIWFITKKDQEEDRLCNSSHHAEKELTQSFFLPTLFINQNNIKMTKLYRIFKTQLLLAVVLFGASFGFAQNGLVQVPTNCNVIEVGPGVVGGVLGAGGKVGPGGIVGMPDDVLPNGGTFTFIPPAGGVVGSAIKWSLLGDLSNTSVAPFYGAPTQPADGLTATIMSYNKKGRPSEATNYALARSKGRVSVGYSFTVGLCVYSYNVTFDIFKTFTTAPPIVGPACIDLGFPVTYSVDQVASDNAGDAIGFDSYYWSGLGSVAIVLNSNYYSADNSSITFTPTTLPLGTVLKCCIGKLNANTIPSGPGPDPVGATVYSNCNTKNLNILPQKPVLSITNLCVDTSVNTVPLTFSGSPAFVSTYTYTWSNVGNLWTVTGTPGNWVLNKNGDNNPGILTLIINNNAGCLPVTYTYNIKRTFVQSATFGIAGPSCISQGGAANNYALSSVANLNAVSWTSSPVGLQLTNGTGAQANTVNIIAPTTSAAGRYTLTATSAAPCAGSVNFTIDVRPPTPSFTTAASLPVAGTSPSCVIRNSGFPVTFTCTPITVTSLSVPTYQWGIPAGWTLAGGSVNPSSVPSITLLPGGTATSAALSIYATVTNSGVVSGCRSGGTNGFTVNYNPVAPTGVTLSAGCFTAGIIGTKTLTITNAQNFGTYTVTSNPAGLIGATAPTIVISGATGTITFPTTGATGTYTITVTHNGVLPLLPAPQVPICGSASSTPTASFTIAAGTAAWAIGFPSYDISAGGSDVYRVNTQPAGTSYLWYHGPATITNLSQLVAIPFPNANPNVSFSPSANQLTLFGATAIPLPSTDIYCIVTPGGGGCPVAIKAIKGTHGIARQTNTSSGGIKDTIKEISVYPNPSNGSFVIKLDKETVNAKAILFDLNGKEIGFYALTKGENTVEKNGLPVGVYNLILDIDGITETQQIIIK